MKKFVGFQIQSGDILNKETGEVTKWSNTFIRTVSDEGLLVGEFGLKIGEAKVKTEYIARSIGINNFDYSPNAINAVISELNKHHNKSIDFLLTLVKGQYTITGIKILPA